MLERVLREIPKLTEAVVARRRQGQRLLRHRPTTGAARRPARPRAGHQHGRPQDHDHGQAHRAPGPQGPGRRARRGRGQGRRGRRERDLPIARYDSLNADEIIGRLAELSQIDLAKVDAYERKNDNRATILTRISTLRGNEPWAGYDEQHVAEIQHRARPGRRVPGQAGPQVRARPQGPRRRHRGRRARDRQRVVRRTEVQCSARARHPPGPRHVLARTRVVRLARGYGRRRCPPPHPAAACGPPSQRSSPRSPSSCSSRSACRSSSSRPSSRPSATSGRSPRPRPATRCRSSAPSGRWSATYAPTAQRESLTTQRETLGLIRSTLPILRSTEAHAASIDRKTGGSAPPILPGG